MPNTATKVVVAAAKYIGKSGNRKKGTEREFNL
jgi:hypothetical protein